MQKIWDFGNMKIQVLVHKLLSNVSCAEIWNQNKGINQKRTLSALSVYVPGSNLYIHIPRYKQSVMQ